MAEKFLHICSILRHLRLKSTNPCSYGLVVLVAVVFIKKVCIDILPWFLPLTPLTLREDMKVCPDAYLGRIVLAVLDLEGSH